MIFALLSQALFPMQATAAPGLDARFVLCTEGGGAVADTVSQKLFGQNLPGKTKPGFMGLKCANCVLASITALPVPAPVSVPVVYTSERIRFVPAPSASCVRARAPPRPHSCGPPETVEA